MATTVDSTQAQWLKNHPESVEDAYMILIPYIKMNTRAGGAIVHEGFGGISDVTSVYIYQYSSRASINDAAKSWIPCSVGSAKHHHHRHLTHTMTTSQRPKELPISELRSIFSPLRYWKIRSKDNYFIPPKIDRAELMDFAVPMKIYRVSAKTQTDEGY